MSFDPADYPIDRQRFLLPGNTVDLSSITVKSRDYTVSAGLGEKVVISCLRCAMPLTFRVGPLQLDAILGECGTHELEHHANRSE